MQQQSSQDGFGNTFNDFSLRVLMYKKGGSSYMCMQASKGKPVSTMSDALFVISSDCMHIHVDKQFDKL
jgi:hypothetical protein